MTLARLTPAAPQPPPEASRVFSAQASMLEAFAPVSTAAACLTPLLEALGWRGTNRHLAEALPHSAETLDIGDLRTVLANLGYATQAEPYRASRLDPRLLPALLIADGGRPLVLLERRADLLRAFDGTTGRVEDLRVNEVQGQLYRVEKTQATERETTAGSWLRRVAVRFRSLIALLFALSLVTNLLALAVPIFIMVVYDKVITAGAPETLYWLLCGIALALALDTGLRLLRGRILAYLGGRIDLLFGTAAFDKVLSLPLGMTERAPIGAQMMRLRQFESVREFFTGPLAGVALDLPFVVMFVAALAILSGWLAIVPLALLLVFGLLAALLSPILRTQVASAGEARSRRQSFLIELLHRLPAIKQNAAEPIWMARFRSLSAEAAQTHRRIQATGSLAQTAAQSLMLTAGIFTLGWGTLMAMQGTLSVGGLIAVMVLSWRVLAPLQVAFLSFTRLEQQRVGLGQLGRLMQLRREREDHNLPSVQRVFAGEVGLHRVSFRYAPTAEPALLGASLQIRPGEIVAIAGPSGAGKSTLLRLIAGLHQAQAGAITLDGLDIRQLDPAELRTSIGFVLQDCELFHGTVAQNLRLADPTASDADLSRAALESGLLDHVLALPDGFHTRLTDPLLLGLPDGFKQQLSLARAYIRRPPVLLMDEPAARLDDRGDAQLLRKLQDLRGKSTVVMVTHRPSHMRAADRLVLLQDGRVADDGPPDEVLGRLKEAG